MKKYKNIPATVEDNRNLCYEIITHLISKYSNQFSFFHSKPITETAFNDSKSTANLSIRDTILFSQDEQCLHRMYYYYNTLGKEQIYERIRIIGKFYEENKSLSEYPLMIVTNTSKIFKTRQRRLKKMVGSNCSSDQSQEQSVKDRSFESKGFLSSMSQPDSSLSMQINEIKAKQHQISFDQQSYSIYSDSPHIYESVSIKITKNDLQKTTTSLIWDFNDIDFEKTMTDFQRITHLKKNNNKFLSVNSLSLAKPIYESIVVSEASNNNDQKYPIINNSKQLIQQSQAQKYARKKLTGQRGIGDNKKVNQYIHKNKLEQYQKYVQNMRYLKVDSGREHANQRNCQEKMKKQMVRQRAMKLLSKVKSQNYINGKHDFNNY